MKLRVLGVLSVLVVALVLLVSNVILSSAGRELTAQLQISRVASLNRIAQLAYDAASEGETAVLKRDMDTYSGLYGEALVVRMQTQTLVSGSVDPQRADIRDALARASLNLSDTTLRPLSPFGTEAQVISRSFGSASQVLGAVVMDVNVVAAREKLRLRWLSTGAAATLLAIVLLLTAGRVTGWVLRPVQRLGMAVRELKETGHSSKVPEAGPPELRELSRSFTEMATTLGELIDSQRQLIADTSHHLRNPIGALRLRVDLLQLELNDARARAAGDGVLAELERVEEILDSVLKLAVAEHRAYEDSLGTKNVEGAAAIDTHVDPSVVLSEEVERAQPAALAAGCILHLVTPEDRGRELKCNRIELAQMIGELLNNAIKYAPGAAITATLRIAPGNTIIEITDTGPGLSTAQLANATTRFWRAEQHSKIRGTGMGMTIVEKLATANAARLNLRPNEPHGLRASLTFVTPPGPEETEHRS